MEDMELSSGALRGRLVRHPAGCTLDVKNTTTGCAVLMNLSGDCVKSLHRLLGGAIDVLHADGFWVETEDGFSHPAWATGDRVRLRRQMRYAPDGAWVRDTTGWVLGEGWRGEVIEQRGHRSVVQFVVGSSIITATLNALDLERDPDARGSKA